MIGGGLAIFCRNVSLEEVRKPHSQLIVEETLRWDREDLCEKRNISRRPHESSGGLLTVNLFRCELLGLSDETEDHEPSDKVKSNIETNCN